MNALRTFEAAARLGGFAAAGEELNVTPAAVSHQLKSLETYLHVALFKRLAQGVELTSAGRELLPEVVKGLAHFERGIGNLNTTGMSGRLVVNVAPSIAILWLLPIVNDFLEAYPEVELQLFANEDPPDLFLNEADIRLVHGSGNFPGLNSRIFLRDTVFPVCAPSLLEKAPINDFADIRHHTLLHDVEVGDSEPSMKWSRWLSDYDLDLRDVRQNIRFGNAILLTNAAVEGFGVALGRSALVGNYLKEGRLVRPFADQRPAERAYYTVTTEAAVERLKVKTFREWVHSKASSQQTD